VAFASQEDHTLDVPFEQVIYRLHIFTDLLTMHCEDPIKTYSKEDCQKLIAQFCNTLRDEHLKPN
jgi:hypothetical protein